MKKPQEFHTLEEGLLQLKQKMNGKTISFAEIMHTLAKRGWPVILILLSLPFCQPLQVPGLSTPFGLAIAFIGLRMTFGKNIWLPNALLEKKFQTKTVEKIAEKTLVVVRKMKHWIQPRLVWLCQSPTISKVNGLIICILGLLLALPLPIPLSNIAAAWGIFLLSFGILEDDGILIILSYLVCGITLIFFLAFVKVIKIIFSGWLV